MKHFDFTFETKSLTEAGEFEGYASTFGNVDQGGDVVEPGAFIESVVKAKADGRVIPMLWQHDQREPIGVWKDIAEDAKGLYVKGQLLIGDDPLAKRAHAHLKNKSIGGMSIGYGIPAGGATPDEKRRGVMRLSKIDLREISLVTMPMNIQARIMSVKATDKQVETAISWLKKAIKLHEAHMDGSEPTSDASQMRMMSMMKKALAALDDDEDAAPMSGMGGKSIITVREFEEHLRDAGFSKSLAAAIAGKAAPHLRGEPDVKANDAAAFLKGLLPTG